MKITIRLPHKMLAGIIIIMSVLFLLLPAFSAHAETAPSDSGNIADDISLETSYSGTINGNLEALRDGNEERFYQLAANEPLQLENPQGISSIYIVFLTEPGEYSLSGLPGSFRMTCGTYGYLKEYLDLEAAAGHPLTTLTIDFGSSAPYISEIRVFSHGVPPDSVQTWQQAPQDGVDLVLFSAHGDDEQLFFAGLLPYYSAGVGYRVQVVYMTDHRDTEITRRQEMLNGLWAVGVRYYPVFGSFPDHRIDNIDEMYAYYSGKGFSKDAIYGFVTEQIRRFKPLVAVGHDLRGEYGHGMHKVYADALSQAVAVSGNPDVFPESAEHYGIWEVPKTYLHLYPDNQIVMDWDTPMDTLGGLSPFAVTRTKGFPCHKSQQVYWFKDWINSSRSHWASGIATYNPCEYGLFCSNVGDDILKNDMFENLINRDELNRLEEERMQADMAEAETAVSSEETSPVTNAVSDEETQPGEHDFTAEEPAASEPEVGQSDLPSDDVQTSEQAQPSENTDTFNTSHSRLLPILILFAAACILFLAWKHHKNR